MDPRLRRVADPLSGTVTYAWVRTPQELDPQLVARGLLMTSPHPARLLTGDPMTPALIPWTPFRERKQPRAARVGSTDVVVHRRKLRAGHAELGGVTYSIATRDFLHSDVRADDRLLATFSHSLVSPFRGLKVRWREWPTGPDEHAMAHVLAAVFGIGSDAEWPELLADLASGAS